MKNITNNSTINNSKILTEDSFLNSKKWFDRAKKVLAGGVSSSARMPANWTMQTPLYITRGNGSRVWDIDNNEFVDHLLSYGSLIVGHSNPVLSKAFESQLNIGTMFGTCNTVEVELAEQICSMVPCADLVRYSNSGSEAISGAIRAARGFTGKNKILKFEGHYHGWIDTIAISNRPTPEQAGSINEPVSHPHSKGIPSGIVGDIIICPWNEPKILKNILNKYESEIAAIIAEPIVANNACIMPQPGYLELLRTESKKRGIVLIFDEIVTGFRIAPGGAQEYFGADCDLAVYSKALGGGMPISAFAGKREIMEPIAKNTVKHGGTYNGNPICALSALETLRLASDKGFSERLNEYGNNLKEIIKKEALNNGIPCLLQGPGSMFQVLFTEKREISHYRDLFDVDAKKFGIFRDKLLHHGIHINGSFSACWFMCSEHNDDDLAVAEKAIKAAMKEIKHI